MEAHFVLKKTNGDGLGVVGVFLEEGAPNRSFATIATAFPKTEGDEAAAPDDANPAGLLPRRTNYWRYEGSLTTPPCSETVDWMVCMAPVGVAKADIAKFTALYPMNARPVQQVNRRFVLRSM
jgi:carbonic anhydrase